MDTGAVLIALALLVLAVPFLGGPLIKKRGKKGVEASGAPEPVEERQTVLLAVRDLDFDFSTGKIAEEDYRSLRAQLLARAASLAPPPEKEQTPVKQESSSERISPSLNGRSCPKCKHTLHAGDLFCSSCGTAISRTCDSCGKETDYQANFCSFCGKAVAGLNEVQAE